MAKTEIMGESIESKEKAYLEAQKLVFDGFKHVTTISTGAILILVAFLEKVFTTPKWKLLIAVSFAGFIISTVCAVICMHITAFDMRSYGEEDSVSNSIVATVALVGTISSFLIAISSLVIFSLRNFF